MNISRLVAAAAIVATSGAAFAQSRNLDGGVNARGTIGPTVTARSPAKDAARTTEDPDGGRYGVPGGVGDPSIGANLTRGFRTAPSSLNQPESSFPTRRVRR
jgi:hypothetical protein